MSSPSPPPSSAPEPPEPYQDPRISKDAFGSRDEASLRSRDGATESSSVQTSVTSQHCDPNVTADLQETVLSVQAKTVSLWEGQLFTNQVLNLLCERLPANVVDRLDRLEGMLQHLTEHLSKVAVREAYNMPLPDVSSKPLPGVPFTFPPVPQLSLDDTLPSQTRFAGAASSDMITPAILNDPPPIPAPLPTNYERVVFENPPPRISLPPHAVVHNSATSSILASMLASPSPSQVSAEPGSPAFPPSAVVIQSPLKAAYHGQVPGEQKKIARIRIGRQSDGKHSATSSISGAIDATVVQEHTLDTPPIDPIPHSGRSAEPSAAPARVVDAQPQPPHAPMGLEVNRSRGENRSQGLVRARSPSSHAGVQTLFQKVSSSVKNAVEAIVGQPDPVAAAVSLQVTVTPPDPGSSAAVQVLEVNAGKPLSSSRETPDTIGSPTDQEIEAPDTRSRKSHDSDAGPNHVEVRVEKGDAVKPIASPELRINKAKMKSRPKWEEALDDSMSRMEEAIVILRNDNHELRETLFLFQEEFSRRHEEQLMAIHDAANESLPFNVQGYLDEFTKSLAIDVRTLIMDIGRLWEERRTLQFEISSLTGMRSQYGPGGAFDPDWRPSQSLSSRIPRNLRP